MQIAVVTLFPELFVPFLGTSLIHRAMEGGLIRVHLEQLREHGIGRHRAVDDTPYGGGSGMVLRPDCVVDAVESAESVLGGRSFRVLMTPQGLPLGQQKVRELATHHRIVLVCGRYEGFDERARALMDAEVSLGDFILSGGEIPAMAVIEACSRLVPGVMGNAESDAEESFSEALGGALEYPQYTRPVEFRGMKVPDVLLSGDHGKIAAWRSEQSKQRTRARRPELESAS